MNKIYIIVWVGRDSDSDVWDEYPEYRFGFFTNEDTVKAKVFSLNKSTPGEFDENAEEAEGYSYREILPATHIACISQKD